MTKPVIHVIGAGLAGLAAAVRLAGGPYDLVLHESAGKPGGAAGRITTRRLG